MKFSILAYDEARESRQGRHALGSPGAGSRALSIKLQDRTGRVTAALVIIVAVLVALAIVYWGAARLRALLASTGVGPRGGEGWEEWARAAPTDELRRSVRILERAQASRVRDGLARDPARDEHLRILRSELSRRG